MTAIPNPLVLNAPRSVAINAGVLRSLTNRGYYSHSVAPVGVFSPGITYPAPGIRTFSVPSVNFAPTIVLSTSQAFNMPTGPLSTTRIRLTLQTVKGAETLNGIQSTANDACRCSPEDLLKLSDRLASLRARLEKLEQGNGRVPDGNAGDDVDDLLRNVN
jgi:hypothetical protein